MPAPYKLLSSWRTIIRYGTNSGVVLALKLTLMHFALIVFAPITAYMIVHFVVFFFSYVIHSASSFRTAMSLARMRYYFGAVVLFKALDYLLFAIVFVAFDIDALWCVVTATIPVFLLRFMFVRRTLGASTTRTEV